MADKTFDIYKDDQVVQAGVPSPVEIDSLAPNTQYGNYAATYAGKSDKTPLSFKTAVQAVTGVSLDKTTLALETGATATVKAMIVPSDATDKAYTFSSDDTAIATVDNNGKITAIKAGTVVITVTTHDDAKTAKVTVTITDPVVKMTAFDLDTYELTGETGGNGKVTVSNVKPANTTDVVVDAVPEDSSIATVKDNGDATFTVTYVKAGTTKVVFTAHDGSGVLHNLTVTVADPAPEG